ncbi:hypothetical protein [Dyadobacter psychrotolerans]|uniref:Uncharacterized protein n=1 Tax=Dyadobacter psychrotolerans TaxID=2541721 RepID=A0A4R5DCT5_9BACT|nr:hypothetical protein [Dyadobacter psychrotolerans]TDE10817.1 hypothetical protein E0F88_27475 [Dyadobacter psychrotolerans]
MSQFSQYRVGNLVTVFTVPGEFGIFKIDSITEPGNYPLFALSNVKTGESLSVEFKKFDGHYPYIMEISLMPEQLGFTKLSDRDFTNGTVDLINITELADDELEESDGPQLTITKFAKLGYSVQVSRGGEYLYTEEYSTDEAAYMGILDVHELQNLYSDLLPGVELDLSGVE